MKRLILCLIAVLFLSATASAEITFVLKDGSKVTWSSYIETQTHYCKDAETTNCIDKADVDTIREVVTGKKGNSTQMIDDNSLKSREREMKEWEAQKKIDEIKDEIEEKVRKKEEAKEVWFKFLGKQLCTGMSAYAVKSQIGEPREINKSGGSYGIHEQWVYATDCYYTWVGSYNRIEHCKYVYLYFEDDKLTSYQLSE